MTTNAKPDGKTSAISLWTAMFGFDVSNQSGAMDTTPSLSDRTFSTSYLIGGICTCWTRRMNWCFFWATASSSGAVAAIVDVLLYAEGGAWVAALRLGTVRGWMGCKFPSRVEVRFTNAAMHVVQRIYFYKRPDTTLRRQCGL